jgi:hypothetical protein
VLSSNKINLSAFPDCNGSGVDGMLLQVTMKNVALVMEQVNVTSR